MDASWPFLLVSLAVLLALAAMILTNRKKEPQEGVSPLAGLAFILVVAGILFGEDRILGYLLLGAGVLLALIDIFRRQGRRSLSSVKG